MLFKLSSLAYALTLFFMMFLNRQEHHKTYATEHATSLRDTQKTPQNLAIHFVLFILLVLHGYACYLDIFTSEGLVFGFAQALSLMAWVGIALYWIESWFFSLQGMLPLVLVLATLFSFLPALFEGSIISTKSVHSPGFKLHFITANIAYGVMFLAALQATLMTWQDRNLRSNHSKSNKSLVEMLLLGSPSRLLDQLPPLMTMERVLFSIIGIGFCLLTVAVFSGVFFSQALFGRALIFDHKTVFALLSWSMFGGLLYAHWKVGLRGTEALRWVFGSFVVLLLAYVGSRFVFEVVLNKV